MKSLQVWLWVGIGAIGLYLALWAGTYDLAKRRVVDVGRGWVRDGKTEFVKLGEFAPTAAVPILSPGDRKFYYFAGNVSSPCPLLASYDVVQYDRNEGSASRSTLLWQGSSWKYLSLEYYWRFEK